MKRALGITTLLVTILIGSFLIGNAVAGQITTFNTGDPFTASALNGNFQHIHNNMVGGHGGRLVDGDVNASAAIAHSKLATPALVPKAWAYIGANCVTPICTEVLSASSGVSTITHDGTGLWTVNWQTTRADNKYAVIVSPSQTLATGKFCVSGVTNTGFTQIACWTATAAASDTPFSIMMMDNL